MPSKIFTIEVEKALAAKMASLSGQLNERARALMEQATKDLAEATYYRGRELAFSKLDSTASTYADALKFDTVAPGVYVVSLAEEAHHLENGYSGFDQKPGLLKNATKRSKLGYRYRSIPFEHKTTGKPKKGTGSGDMLTDLRRIRAAFGDKGITKTASGQDMLGKIFSVRPDDLGNWNLRGAQAGVADQNVRFANGQPSQNLAGVVKYQWQQQLRNGGVRTRTSFMTFRTVSEDPRYAQKWRHPGFAGIHVMDELADWAAQQLPKMFEDIFRRS